MFHFQLQGLDPALFQSLFELDDQALQARGMRRRIADDHPGFPCRVSLRDAEVGEEVLLLPFEHHAVDSPYRASGPIFVRRGAAQAQLEVGEVPDYVRRRLISIRAYDAAAMMRHAEVLPGEEVAARLQELFATPDTAYAHLHNARPGCFSCHVVRR